MGEYSLHSSSDITRAPLLMATLDSVMLMSSLAFDSIPPSWSRQVLLSGRDDGTVSNKMPASSELSTLSRLNKRNGSEPDDCDGRDKCNQNLLFGRHWCSLHL